MKKLYIHLINNMPGRFDGSQICYADSKFHPIAIPLNKIKIEQRATIKFREKFLDDEAKYGYIRIILE